MNTAQRFRFFALLVFVGSLAACGQPAAPEFVRPTWMKLPASDTPLPADCKGRYYKEMPVEASKPVTFDPTAELARTGVTAVHWLSGVCAAVHLSAIEFKDQKHHDKNHYEFSIVLPQLDSRCIEHPSLDFCPKGPSSFGVLHAESLRLTDVDPEISRKKMSELVSFDAQTRLVAMNLGAKRVEYRLPERVNGRMVEYPKPNP